eukprot:5934232-Prymnesium_polylepis.2
MEQRRKPAERRLEMSEKIASAHCLPRTVAGHSLHNESANTERSELCATVSDRTLIRDQELRGPLTEHSLYSDLTLVSLTVNRHVRWKLVRESDGSASVGGVVVPRNGSNPMFQKK